MGLDVDQALDFAAQHRRGVLATLRREGRPQLSNIRYLVDDDGAIRISVTDSRAKTANLRRDPRASLHVTREDFFAYVVLEGIMDLTPVATSPDDAVVDQLVGMYRMAQGEHPDWDEFRQAMVTDGRLVATLSVQRAYGMIGN
jgi:PPOX class probable F420-dependent enzyme